MENTITVTGRGSIHVVPDIHSNEEAMSCNPESLDITSDNLVVSDDVNVVWKRVAL